MLTAVRGTELAACENDREALGLILGTASVRVPLAFLDQVRTMSVYNAEGQPVTRFDGEAWKTFRPWDCELSATLYFVVFSTASCAARIVAVDVVV